MPATLGLGENTYPLRYSSYLGLRPLAAKNALRLNALALAKNNLIRVTSTTCQAALVDNFAATCNLYSITYPHPLKTKINNSSLFSIRLNPQIPAVLFNNSCHNL